MTNALALITDRPEWESKLDLIRRTIAVDHSDDELALFLYHASRTGLDPLARQIYSIKRGGRATIQTGIDGYRLIADRTGLYAGNDDATFGEHISQGQREPVPGSATVTVWKMVAGARCPFTATARWEEYCPPSEKNQDAMWRKMPHLMIQKCAEALALRKAFPAELSGLYTDDEMAQADAPSARTVSSVSTVKPERKALKPAASVADGPVLPATEPQVKAIYSIARKHQLDEAETEAQCVELFGVRPTELNRRQASEYIDALQREAAAPGAAPSAEPVEPVETATAAGK